MAALHSSYQRPPQTQTTKLCLIIVGSPLVPYALNGNLCWKYGRKAENSSPAVHMAVSLIFPTHFFEWKSRKKSKCFLGFEWLGKFLSIQLLACGDSRDTVYLHRNHEAVRHWRSKGIRVLKYMDDFPSCAPSAWQQRIHGHYMVEHLRSLGGLIQASKLQGIPVALEIIRALWHHYLLPRPVLPEILENNWVHPPYALLGRVLRHILRA